MKRKLILGLAASLAFADMTAQAWVVTGNATGASDFLGTTTAGNPLKLWSNNQQNASLLANGDFDITNPTSNGFSIGGYQVLATHNNASNIMVGFKAGKSQTGGLAYNTMVGDSTGYTVNGNITSSVNGYYNTFVGGSAGFKTTGNCNSALGYFALYRNTSGYANVGIGLYAGSTGTTGSGNIAIGDSALLKNSTGSFNAAVGYQALYTNTASHNNAHGFKSLYSNTSGTPNDAFGNVTLFSNTTGFLNDAFGDSALYANTTGVGNVAFGTYALRKNTTASNNSAGGSKALYSNTGAANTAFGYAALYTNTTSNHSAAFGYEALQNSTGGENTAVGYGSLQFVTTGANNTAVGNVSGAATTTGSNNTFLGNGADVSAANAGTNNLTAIGSGAINNQAANTIMFGTTGTALWCVGGGNFATSDGRFKTNVTENVKGLEFIKKLRPVTYNMNTQALDDFLIQGLPDSLKAIHRRGLDLSASAAVVHAGFIAQEVQQAAQETQFSSSIVSVPADPNVSNYGLNYAEIVVPLVKAVQELSHKVDSLLGITQSSSQRSMQNNGSQTVQSNGAVSINNIELVSGTAVIYQNAPNPFGDGTTIKYFIPEKTNNAQVVFYDEFGNQMKAFAISEVGQGQLNITSINLAPGVYSYSLIINGKIIDTKKMMKTN